LVLTLKFPVTPKVEDIVEAPAEKVPAARAPVTVKSGSVNPLVSGKKLYCANHAVPVHITVAEAYCVVRAGLTAPFTVPTIVKELAEAILTRVHDHPLSLAVREGSVKLLVPADVSIVKIEFISDDRTV